MNIYLAGRCSRRLELLGYAEQLTRLGHTIASTWIDGHHETRPNIDTEATAAEKALWAAEDLDDLVRADCAIFFTNEPNGQGRERGGYHVEFGWVLGWNIAVGNPIAQKRLIVVGPRVNVFHMLDLLPSPPPPHLEHFDSWSECMAAFLVAKEELGA